MNNWRQHVALSSGGLKLFRRGLGVLCLFDVLSRIPDASFFLSDLGVLPRSHYYSFFQESCRTSLLLFSGQPLFVYLFLIVAACLSVAQIAGRSNRLSRLALWLIVLSVQFRNPGILGASDDLLRLSLFWDIWLPTEHESQEIVSAATLGLQCQMTLTLVGRAIFLGPENIQLSARWSGVSDWVYPTWFGVSEQVALVALVLAIWFRPSRFVILLAASPFLVTRGFVLHPLFPLTMAVALSFLWGPKSSDDEVAEPQMEGGSTRSNSAALRVLAASVVAASIVSAMPVSGGLKATARPLAELLGLEQNWGSVYPLAAKSWTEILARDRITNVPLWSIGLLDSRRRRLFAQKVAENPAWSQGLGAALKEKEKLDMEPFLWMSIQNFGAQSTLGVGEVRLLSATPVVAPTRRATP